MSSHPWRPLLSPLLFVVSLLSWLATPASGQYIYLDANGDGEHSAADVLAPNGTTTFGVWLVTNANRNGGAATCATGEDLTINSYAFIVRATNGNMTWGAFTNLLPMATSLGSYSSTTEFYAGFGVGTLPPGKYHLGTLEAGPAFGTPALAFAVSSATLPGALSTSFGSQCFGQDLDNTMKLGTDWFDADGADYGGTAQVAPVLDPVSDMSVAEGAVAEQALTATDADGQPLQFEKVSGPAYMVVATTQPGAGTAHGKITLSPGPTAAGVATGGVRVTDGLLIDQKTFAITVVAANSRPVIQAQLPITLVPNSGIVRAISRCTDPDGDAVSMRARDLASFMVDFDFPRDDPQVESMFHPAACDVGDWFLYLEATDGIATTNAVVPVRVTGSEPGPSPPKEMFRSAFHGHDLKFAPADMASGDIDGDGIDDLALTSDAGGFIQWMRGDGRGGFADARRLPAHSPVLVKLADLDGNGVLDAVYTDRADGTMNVALGPLLAPAPTVASYPAVSGTAALALGDFDGDGSVDAAIVGLSSSSLLLFLNDGTGALRAPRSIPIPAGARSIATGDVNGDGALDFALVHDAPHMISLHRNAGDGSFLPPIVRIDSTPAPYPVPGAIAMRDLNQDGRSDLVTWIRFGGIQVYLTDPAGDLLPAVAYDGPGRTAIELADISGDGIPDLITTGSVDGRVLAIQYRKGAGDGTFLASQGIPTFGSAMAFAAIDVDRDGDRDVVVTSNFDRYTEHLCGGLAIYDNDGSGRFGSELITSGPAVQGRAIFADVNADGHLDVLGLNGTHLGRGDGTFGPLIGSATGHDQALIVTSDLNRDGHVDLMVGTESSSVATVKLGDGTGQFVTAGTVGFSFPGAPVFAVGDLNGDGIPDIVAGSLFYDLAGPRMMEVRLGLGNATFGPSSTVQLAAAVTSIRLLDLEGDGDLDALVSDFYIGSVRLLPGRGDGTFEAPRVISPSFAGTSALALGDIDSDGLMDIVTREYQQEGSIAVIRQLTPGSFTNPMRSWSNGGFVQNFPVPLSLADLDRDGRLDLVTGTHGSVVIGMGTGTGEFGRRGFFGPGGAAPLVGDVNEDGWPDIVLNGSQFIPIGSLRVLVNQFGRPREARAFASGGSKTIAVGARGHNLCLRVEPVAGSYANADVDLASFRLRSVGTGLVEEISAIPAKNKVLGDEDRNGVEELGVCFSATDLGALFSEIQGRRSITVTLEGELTTPGRILTELTLTIVSTGPSSSAPRISPNPLNPSGALSFTTSRFGAARIRLFDVRGRMVRGLLDRTLEAGEHAIPFDGRDGLGRSLASGVYFATVETVEGTWRVRVAILK